MFAYFEAFFAALGIAFCSYVVTVSAERVASALKLSTGRLVLIAFPFITAVPEITVISVSIAAGGRYGLEAALTTSLGEPFIMVLLGLPLIALVGIKRGVQVLPSIRGIYVMPLVAPIALLAIVLLLNGSIAIGPALILLFLAIYVLMLRSAKNKIGTSEAGKGKGLAAAVAFVAGLAGLVILVRVLINAVEAIATNTNVNPVLLALLAFPLAAGTPELITGVMFAAKQSPDAAIAATFGEFIIESALLPGISLLFHPYLVEGLVKIVAVTATASILTIIAGRIGRFAKALIVTDLALFVFTILTI